MVAAILGTLKAGKVYLPLEPRFPAARLRQIFGASGAGVVIFDSAHQQQAAQLAPAPGAQIDLDRAADQHPHTAPARSVGPDDICYVLYTSGSTGQPKGVYQNHRNVLHHIRQHTHALHITPSDRVALLAPFSAAASIHPLLGALLNGAALCPFDVKEHGAHCLAPWLSAQRITLYHSVPAVFRQVAGALGPGPNLPHLRLIRLGGDQVLPGDVDFFRKHFAPGSILVVSFGASETHTVCWHWLDRQTAVPAEVVPIGRAVEGAEVLVLDETGEPVRAGEVGEIAVRSRHIALGYWNDPERTRASFGDADAEGRRTYRTGDLGRQLPDGCLVHMGRKDLRVKIRGQAVDLAEVEAALAALMPVSEVAVAAPPDRNGQPRLVGYVVAAADGLVSPGALRAGLARTLPDFMVPSAFVRLDALPRTPNGKVDRQALPPPGDDGHEGGWEYVAPRTPLEERLTGPAKSQGRAESGFHTPPRTELERAVAAVWADLLGVRTIGVHDDFFVLGGHSLLAARMIDQVGRSLGLKLELADLYRSPTVAALCAAARSGRPPVPVKRGIHIEVLREGWGPVSVVCVGFLDCLGSLLKILPDGLALWWLRYDAVYVRRPTIRPLPEMAAALATELTAAAPSGAILLFGFSFAGLVTYELARQLRTAGREVDVVLLEPLPPGGAPSSGAVSGKGRWARARRHFQAVRQRPPREALQYLSAVLRASLPFRIRQTYHRILRAYYGLGMTLGWWATGLQQRWWYFLPLMGRRVREYAPTFCPGTVHLVGRPRWRESIGRGWPEHSAGEWVWHAYPEAADHKALVALPAAGRWLALVRDLAAARRKG
jgi:amino acid adenylation domain-containing protein